MTDENGSQAQQRDSKRAFQEGLAKPREDVVRPTGEEDQAQEHEKGSRRQGRPAANRQAQAHRQVSRQSVDNTKRRRIDSRKGGVYCARIFMFLFGIQ